MVSDYYIYFKHSENGLPSHVEIWRRQTMLINFARFVTLTTNNYTNNKKEVFMHTTFEQDLRTNICWSHFNTCVH